jgi:hypothetical protein
VVIVDQPHDAPRVPFVGIDDRAGARSAAEHIRGLGHRRIAIVSFATTAPGVGDLVFPGPRNGAPDTSRAWGTSSPRSSCAVRTRAKPPRRPAGRP